MTELKIQFNKKDFIKTSNDGYDHKDNDRFLLSIPFLHVSKGLSQYFVTLYNQERIDQMYEPYLSSPIYHDTRAEAVAEMMQWSADENLSFSGKVGFKLRQHDYDLLTNQIFDKNTDKSIIDDFLYEQFGSYSIIDNSSEWRLS